MTESILSMVGWLGELIFSSWLLSEGAEHLSERWGGKFIGRTFLSIATTLPEIAIVVSAAKTGSYGIAIGSAIGSNLFMITLGLSIMIIIATTKLSKAPQKFIDVKYFKFDKILLIITAVVGVILFTNGYDVFDGIVFAGLFATYIYLAFREMRREKESLTIGTQLHEQDKISKKHIGRSILLFAAGTAGIFIGAGPFVESLQGLAIESGVSVVVLAVIISPIAGEMPEKISMIFLARKGAGGASIAVANVLGSKILNNTLLLAIAVFVAIIYGGFSAKIQNTPILEYQMILVTVITIVALIPMFKNKLDMKSGVLLLILYAIGIGFQSLFHS